MFGTVNGWFIFFLAMGVIVFISANFDRHGMIGFRTPASRYSDESWKYANTRWGIWIVITTIIAYLIAKYIITNNPLLSYQFFICSVAACVLIISAVLNHITKKKFIKK